jgi:hypothetical protein
MISALVHDKSLGKVFMFQRRPANMLSRAEFRQNQIGSFFNISSSSQARTRVELKGLVRARLVGVNI